jgi:uncharacterized protein
MERYKKIDPGCIGFDIDCVVADTMETFIRLALHEYGISIQPEDITSFEVEKCLAVDPRIIEEIFDRLLVAPVECGLQPMPDAVDVLTALSSHAPLTFITARPVREPIDNWLAQLLPAAVYNDSRLVAMGNHNGKAHFINRLGLQYFIDDRVATCVELADAGFSPIVFDQPWNRGKHTLASVDCWSRIKKRIIRHEYDSRCTRTDNPP